MGFLCGRLSPVEQDHTHMPTIIVNPEWCKGCYICVELCPRKVLDVDPSAFVHGFHPVVVVRPEDCSVCRQCELLCPDLAIMVEEIAP
jgi:2-oxoglutarate ferredoxin oxidoreductase subunit delta